MTKTRLYQLLDEFEAHLAALRREVDKIPDNNKENENSNLARED